MPADRFFVAGVHAPGATVDLAVDDARKLRTVLRVRGGERIEIVDSGGVAYAATLALDGDAVHATLDAVLPRDGIETAARIVLAQAIPKGQKMDLVVEKATELGVAAIVPVRSARVAGERTGAHKRERWERIARTAAQQSGRTAIPAIEDERDWEALLATFASYERVWLPWELHDPAPLRDVFEREARGAGPFLVVIGPEGGFAEDEVTRARLAGAGIVSLGRRILRTETAGLVVLAALLYARGEL